jgi:hypothetical protein
MKTWSYKKLFIIFICLILVILFLVMMQLLGYRFNKEFLSFNRQQCINKEYPTYNNHSGIEGCIFWMRNDYLEKSRSWASLFNRDENYCDQKYKNNDKPGVMSLKEWFNGERSDSKCNYEAFKDLKRRENWDYLVSKEKDGFYDYCVDKICPKQALFK